MSPRAPLPPPSFVLPDSIRWSSIQARLQAASDFDEAFAVYEAIPAVHGDTTEQVDLLEEINRLNGESPHASVFLHEKTMEAVLRDVHVRATEALLSQPAIDYRVLGAYPFAYQATQRNVSDQTPLVMRLVEHPLFAYAMLTIPTEVEDANHERVLTLLAWRPVDWSVGNEVANQLLEVDVQKELKDWMRERSLGPRALDSVSVLQAPGKLRDAQRLLHLLRKGTRLSLPDMLLFMRDWDGIWRAKAARKRLVLPPNEPLLAALRAMDLGDAP